MKQITSTSEIQISPKDGIKAEGFISWAVVFLLAFFIYAKYIHVKIVSKIKTRRARKKKK